MEDSVRTIHQFARELRPALLDDLGLVPALHSFLKGFTERTGIHARLTAFVGIENLDIGHRTVLFRVAQEALTNVGRHSGATRVQVTIQRGPASICMKIQDDGKSFSPLQARRHSGGERLGLLGMKERVELIGGAFSVESARGEGATITATISLRKAAEGS